MTINKDNITVLNDLTFFEKVQYRAKLVITVTILVLLVIAISLFLKIYITTEHKNVAYQQFSALQSTSSQLSSKRQYDQAARLWIAYVPKAPTKMIANTAYVNAAALYVSNAQYVLAITMCNKAEALDGVTLDEASAAATAYQMLGNKTKAINNYETEKRLLPPNAFNRNVEIVEINQAITELQN
jgi:tetratricopeptide (TPR) repeat protein